MPQEPHVAASWSDNGKVYLWDLAKYIAALDGPVTGTFMAQPLKTVTNHKSEGFALAWSLLEVFLFLVSNNFFFSLVCYYQEIAKTKFT
jgi:ribosome assembly protein RRB1